MVYRRNRHVINLFVQANPNARPEAPRLQAQHGYNLLRWAQPGFAVWAVTDLNRSELEDFQRLWSQASAS